MLVIASDHPHMEDHGNFPADTMSNPDFDHADLPASFAMFSGMPIDIEESPP